MASSVSGKFKLIFGDVLRSARKLWLEMMGGLFLALGVMFTLSTISTYRKTGQLIKHWDFRTEFTIFGSAVFSFLMLAFSLQCFWKARKIR
jgi:hypothetical protein